MTAEDIMMHAIHFLYAALKNVPNSLLDSQLVPIEAIRTIFAKWQKVDSSPTIPPTEVPNPPKPILPFPKPSPLRYPAPTPNGDHGKDKGDQEPIDVRTR